MAAPLHMYGGPRQNCPVDEQCSEWIFNYLGDCVCDFRDMVSFLLGLASVLSWGVAEIPQIVANFTAGSTEGVSLTFLMTWTIGDVFNVAGCYLEPATLPTQFFMAVLYTITTVVLVAQSVWYEYAVPRKHLVHEVPDESEQVQPFMETPTVRPSSQPLPLPSASTPQATASISVPISLSRKSSSKDIYITSARSLASSHTPTIGSFMPGSAGHHSQQAQGGHSLLSQSPGVGQPHVNFTNRALVMGVMLLGGLRMGAQLDWAANHNELALRGSSHSVNRPFVFAHSGRRLLQHAHITGWLGGANRPLTEGGSIAGQIMGWCMAAIYMGGRLPQIYLNIKRGTVEGLSPLMFLFALTGNLTYVGSILVRSLAWEDLQPNMAWLVDAGVCVFLDFFIIGQFVYYSLRKAEQERRQEYEALK